MRSLKEGDAVRLSQDSSNASDVPLDVAAPCLAVPVRSGVPEASAVAFFGLHQSGNDITPDESEMLERLAARAAMAYERVFTAILREQVTALKQELAAQQPAAPPPPAVMEREPSPLVTTIGVIGLLMLVRVSPH